MGVCMSRTERKRFDDRGLAKRSSSLRRRALATEAWRNAQAHCICHSKGICRAMPLCNLRQFPRGEVEPALHTGSLMRDLPCGELELALHARRLLRDLPLRGPSKQSFRKPTLFQPCGQEGHAANKCFLDNMLIVVHRYLRRVARTEKLCTIWHNTTK